MTPAAETGVKRRSSRLRFFRCFTAVDDEESCSPALEDVSVKETNGGRVGRLSDLRPSSPVTPRQKKRFWIFSGAVESVSPDSFLGFAREKKHWRRKRCNGQLSEWNNKLNRKQDNLLDIITNSNKDLIMETDTIGSSSSSSFSTNTTSIISSSDATLSSTSSTSSFNSSSTTCVSKHKTIIDSGLCVIVVSLLVVIMWGKVCAIVCTSTWLCIIFGRPSKPLMTSASHPDI